MSIAELFDAKQEHRAQMFSFPRRRRGPSGRRELHPRHRKFLLEPLEPRLLLSGNPLTFAAAAGQALDLTLRLQEDPTTPVLQLVNNADPDPATRIVASQALADTNGVAIAGAEQDDRLKIDLDFDALVDPVPISFSGGEGDDTLVGPDTDNLWEITGVGEGKLNSQMSFTDVENLVGGSEVDTFTLFAGGGLSGAITGGDGSDKLVGPDADTIWDVTGSDVGELKDMASGERLANFIEIEKLTGAVDNQDTFLFAPGGSISGMIDGGEGGFDSLGIQGGNYETVVFTATGADSGSVALDQTIITYKGLEPTEVIGGTIENVVIDLSVLDGLLIPSSDVAKLSLSEGTVTFESNLPSGGATFENLSFDVPSESLTIKLGGGDDKLHISTLDPFDADLKIEGNNGQDTVYIDGDLNLPGRNLEIYAETIIAGFAVGGQNEVSDWEPGAKYPICIPVSTSGSGTGMTVDINVDSTGKPHVLVTGKGSDYAIGDTVTFECPGDGNGSPITLTVLGTGELGLSISTRDLDTAGDIMLVAEDNSLRQGWVISPLDVWNRNTAAVIISGAAIEGGNVTITAAAEDENLYDDYGAYADKAMESLFGLLDQIPGLAVSSILGISGQVVVRRAEATVSVAGSTIVGSGNVAVGSSANTDASLHTVSLNGVVTEGAFTLSVGYGEAQSTATITIDRTAITTDGAIDITSGATTKAYVKSRTSSNLLTPTNPNNVTLAVAVAKTLESSHVAILEGSSVTSLNEGVRVAATGGVTNFAWSQPTINTDGTVAVAFALDFDKAVVQTLVDGEIDAAGGVGNTFDAREGGDVDYGANTIRILNHGFADGQKVTYSHGVTDAPLGEAAPPDIGGLKDGQSYYVQVVDQDTIRLANGPTIDLDYSFDPDGDPEHTLGLLKVINFDSANVDPGEEKITFAQPHGFQGGEALTYLGTSSNPDEAGIEQNQGVGGLEKGKTYYVISIPGNVYAIQLAEEPGTSPVDLTDAGVGQHSFAYQSAPKSFAPKTAVNAESNTITFTAEHEFQTGDAVVYHTDPTATYQKPLPAAVFEQDLAVVNTTTLTLPKDQQLLVAEGVNATLVVEGATINAKVASVSYDSVNDVTTIVLDQGVLTGALTRATFASSLTVAEVDAPVEGLTDGSIYYVVRVDDHTIRLAPSKGAALNAKAIDLEPALDLTGVGLGDKHSLQTSSSPDGISVHAGLTATNAIVAAAKITTETSKWTSALTTGGDRTFQQTEELINLFAQLGQRIFHKQPENSPVQAGAEFGIAGAIGINYADHDVTTVIGPTGHLASSKDIDVSAEISQASQVASTSGASKPTDQPVEASVAVAVGLGIFNNTAKAIVDSGAELDANHAIAVSSSVNYGFLISNPLSAINPVDYLKTVGPEGWAFFMDGTLGFASNLFNTFVMTSASQGKVAGGGSFALNIYNNTSEARIKNGAKINQQDDLRFRAGEQSVAVAATTDMNLIGVVGVGGLSLNIDGLTNAFSGEEVKKAIGGKDKILTGLKELVNPFGAEGDEDGIGASFLVEVVGNTTEAVIEGGALVHTGALTVDAQTSMFDFALAEAGGKATSFGAAGAVAVGVVNNKTKAHIDSGAIIDSDGAITVKAADDLTRIGITGGIVAGANTGVGVSVSVNVINRNTQAFVGTELDKDAGEVGTNIIAAGPMTLEAKSTGALWTASVAAAVTGSPPTEKEIVDNERIRNAPAKAQKVLGETGQTYELKVGVGVAGDVSVNVVDEETYAYINDRGSIVTDGKLDVSSTNDTSIWSLAGSVAISLKGEKTSKGIAGSISANVISNDTKAFVSGTTLDAASLSLLADQKGGIRSLTAAGSGAPLKEGIAFAGSISVNVVIDTVEAYLAGGTATLAESSSIKAQNECQIWAIGGAFAYGGKAGVGVGIAVNVMGADGHPNVTRAYIEDSTVMLGNGTLEVSAFNENPTMDPRIIAITGSVGIGSGPESFAGAGTISVNILSNDTDAYIKSSAITELDNDPGTVNMLVKARDNSGIVAISGAVGVSQKTSIGAAIGYNEIDNDVTAYLDNVDLTTNGTLTVQSSSESVIGGATVGVAAATGSGKFAGAGSVSINIIKNTIGAYIANTVDDEAAVTTEGDILLSAADKSRIFSIAGGVAGTSKGDAALGAAISYNLIQNQIDCYIEDATIRANGPDSSIDLSATSDSLLVAIAVGGAGAKQFAFGGSVTVNSIANTLDAHIADTPDVYAGEDISLTAGESDRFLVIAGGLGVATKSSAMGAAIAYNYIGGSFDPANPNLVDRDSTATDQISAYIDNAHVSAGGDLTVVAGYTPSSEGAPTQVEVGQETIELPEPMSSRILSITVGAAGADEFALGGSVSINVIAHDIQAYIAGSRRVEADGSILVSAVDDLDTGSLAGGFGLAKDLAFGIANATQVTKNTVEAYIGQGAILQAGGNGNGVDAFNGMKNDDGTPQTITVNGLAVTATSFEDVLTVAVGGAVSAGSTGLGVAGSAAVTVLNETTKAYIAENASINKGTTNEGDDQSVLVLASDRTYHTGIGGGAAFGGDAGVGAGIDVGVFVKNTEARIGSGADVEARRNVEVQAFSEERVFSFSGGGGIGKEIGLAGGADVYVLDITTKGIIEGGKTVAQIAYEGATVTADGSIVVAAEEKSTLDVISGNVAFGKSAGIGGSAGVPVVVKTTEAFIGNGASVDAKAEGGGVDVRTGQFIVTFGADSGEEGEVAPFDIGNSDVTDPLLTFERSATPETREGFQGVAVTAVNQDNIETWGVGAGLSTTTSFQLSATVNVMTSSTRAYIGDGANVNQDQTDTQADQSVLVAAGNDYCHMGIAGAVAVTFNISGAAITPGADVTVAGNTTEAHIGAGAHVNAKKDIEVRAHAAEDILSIAAAIAGGGNFSGAGSVSVIVLDNQTYAYIGNGAVVNAGGNALVSATDATDADVVAGALGVGLNGGGAGVGVGVIVINKDTLAYIGQGADVNAKGNSAAMVVLDGRLDDFGNFGTTQAADDVRGLAVEAVSGEDVSARAAAGAGGLYFGVAGGVTVEVIDSNTRAYIDAGARINTDTIGVHDDQDVHVSAANDLTMLIIAGAVAGAAGGVAGGVDVGVVRNDTTAYIAGSDVRARRDIAVNAMANREIESYAVSAGVGAFGLAAAVSVYALGGNFQSTYSFDKNDDGTVGSNESENALPVNGENTTTGFADGQVGVAGLSDLLGSYSNPNNDPGTHNTQDVQDATSDAQTRFNNATPDNPVGGATAATVNTTQTVGTQTVPRGTSAFIGINAGIEAGRHLDLDARERIDLTMIGGGLGVGGLGIGAGISILTADEQVQAFIGRGATVRAGTLDSMGDVLIDAWLKSDLSVLAVTPGFGAIAGLAGSVVVINDSSAVSAYIEAGSSTADSARILCADQVVLTAERDVAIHASALGVAATGGYGLGAAVAIADVSGETRAEVGDWTQIGANTGPVHGLNVDVDSTVSIGGFEGVPTMAVGLAVAGGGAGAAGVALAATNANTRAAIGGDAMIHASGLVSIEAKSDSNADVDADGGALGSIAVGGMVASAQIGGATRATVGSRTRIISDGLDMLGTATTTADVDTFAAAGGIVAGSGSVASVTVDPTVQAFIGDGAQILVTDSILVEARSLGLVTADAQGFGLSGIQVGISRADAIWSPTIIASVGVSARVMAGADISVLASSNHDKSGAADTTKVTRSNATSSSGSLIGGVGADATATTTANVAASIGNGSTLTAGNDVMIRSLSNNSTEAEASGKAFAIAGGGITTATSSITNVNLACTSDNVSIAAGRNFTLSAQTIINSNAEVTGGAGGVLAGASTTARTVVDDQTTVAVGDGSTVTAGDMLLVEALTAVDAHSKAGIETGAAATFNLTESDTYVAAHTRAEVGTDVTLIGNTVEIHAKVTKLDADADAFSKTIAAYSTTDARSFVDVISDTAVIVQSGADITGKQRLELIARQDGVDVDSDAIATILAGLTGTVRATGHNDLDLDSNVDIRAGSTLVSDNVFVQAESPKSETTYGHTADADAQTIVQTVVETLRVVQKAVRKIPIIGWFVKWITKLVTVVSQVILQSNESALLTGAFTSDNAINLAGDIFQGASSNPGLLINADGSFDAVGVTAEIVGNEVVVSDITGGQGAGSILLSSPGGAVSGSGTIHKNSNFATVTIVNNSNLNLRINNIRSINPNTVAADLQIESDPDKDSSSFSVVSDLGSGLGCPVVLIENNSAADVLFAGEIENPTGITTVTNQGGHILALPGAFLEGRDITLEALQGQIGEAANRLGLRLYTDESNATLTAEAQGAIYLETRLLEIRDSSTPVSSADIIDGADFNSIVAGGDIDVHALPSQVLVPSEDPGGSPTLTDVRGTYHLNNVTSEGGNVRIVVDSGDLRLGRVVSAAGDVWMEAEGSILDGDGGTNSDIEAANVWLSALAGSIGTDGEAVEIDSAMAGDGMLTASALQSVYLTETAGNLTLDHIAATGEVRLKAAGAIRDDDDGSVTDVIASHAVLTAGLGVGEAGNPMETQLAMLEADAGNGGVWVVNTGALEVGDVTATGTVSIIALSPLTVSGVVSGATLVLEATDAPGPGDDLTVEGGAMITATTGPVALIAGDNLTIEAGSGVESAGQVLLSFGGNAQLSGTVLAESMLVTGTDGDNVVVIRELSTDTIVQTLGGNDTIHVGSNATEASNAGGKVNAITASLTVDGGSGFDTVTVDDTGDLLANKGTLTQDSLSGLDMGEGLQYAGIENLVVSLGSGGDTFAIDSTHAGATQVAAGPGNDFVYVRAISGATYIKAGDDDDAINVGRLAPDVLGQVHGIAALLSVMGGNGADQLNVDDSGDDTDNNGTLTGSTLTGLGMRGSLDYAGIEALTVVQGTGNDTFNVQSTSADTVTALETGAGDDAVVVSSTPSGNAGTLDGIVGMLNIDAGPGAHNVLNVSDAGDPDADTNVVIRCSSISGLAPAIITYTATGGFLGGGIDISGGAGGNHITVESTRHDPSVVEATQVKAGARDDEVVITDLDPLYLVVHGQTGDDRLDGSASPDGLTLFGDAGNDWLLGGTGNDVLVGDSGTVKFSGGVIHEIETVNWSEGGNDVLMGGEGEDVLIGGASDDAIDGGPGQDLIFGDNVLLVRNAGSGNAIDPRFRALTRTTIYDASANPQVGSTGQARPGGMPAWADWTITLDQTLDPTRFGNDYITGGPDDDMIFGQLGDDTIQGDGSIGSKVAGGSGLDAYRDGAGLLVVRPSAEASTDGDDYIEGNGGNDVIFGNLGQDDIIGGSSSLFSLTTPGLRPDGADLIFGGAGTDITRNNNGDETASGHARDADLILGDNGNIYRLVGINGTNGGNYLTFNYDNYNTLKIIPRAAELLDYTPGGPDFNPTGASSDIGAADEVHGESGDDSIYGGKGNDVLYGEGQDDDIIGGYGNDWISGGTGDDGVIGDDGRLYTSRNGTAEPLYGLPAVPVGQTVNQVISTPGNIQQATINVSGQLKKTVNLEPFSVDVAWNAMADEFGGVSAHHNDDIIYGGWGNDFLHGGSGDDAISGAEALTSTDITGTDPNGKVYPSYDKPYSDGNVLGYSPTTTTFARYDEYNPLTKISGFLLNFNASEGPNATGTKTDGNDMIFGDLSNDWIVGGTGKDHLYGGWGNDLLNADDNLDTAGGANTGTDTDPTYEDIAYGGGGRDVLIANTGGDRLIDWVGEFNSYITPFAAFGTATVSRTIQPQLPEYLYALSASDGADPTRSVDTGAEAIRNGEPWGELGVIIQKDFAWHDQTGAPRDVQAGNLPGGQRDVLRAATFNTVNAANPLDGFAVDSGSFTVANGALQVAAQSLGKDAAAVFYVDQALSSYYEVLASLSVQKPTGGWKANAYIIFDYYGPKDFKFAGIDVSLNRFVMGHRNAQDWILDAFTPTQVKPDTYYNLLLAVNGTTATLMLDNAKLFSYTFAPRLVDGYACNLNTGMVGVGSENSRGVFDNITVQRIAPQTTFQDTEDFTSTTGLFTQTSGTWQLASGRYSATPVNSDRAVSLVTLPGLSAGAFLEFQVTLNTQSTGGFIYDYYTPEDFKYVAIKATTNQVILGHHTSKGWFTDAVTARTIGTGDHALVVSLKGTTVSVTLDGQAVTGFVYNAITIDGKFGIFSANGSSSFDNVSFRTDDPAFLNTGTPLLASAAATSPSEVLSPDALAPIRDEAISRWSSTLDSTQKDLLQDVNFLITDLPGLTLGRTSGYTVLIDTDAAGNGWFIDPTPFDNSEFTGGRGPSGVDLLTVVMHEMGHVLGYGDLDPATTPANLMDATLDGGVRRLPAGLNTMGDVAFEGLSSALASRRNRNSGDAHDRLPAEPSTLGDVAFDDFMPVMVSRRNGDSGADHDRLPAIGDVGLDTLASGRQSLIDWNGRYMPAVVADRVLGGQAPTRMAQAWGRDFVLELAAGDNGLGPNADISVTIPVIEDTSRELAEQSV